MRQVERRNTDHMKRKVSIMTKLVMPMIGLLTAYKASAQDPGGDPDLPIDSGTSLLLVLGIGYGILKIVKGRAKRIKNKEARDNT